MRDALMMLACLAGPMAAADLWTGIAAGPYSTGFRFRQGTDVTRSITAGSRGKRLGLAIWYPARPGASGPPVTQIEYRLLAFANRPGESAARAFLDDEATMMVEWRHASIVPLTLDQ